MHTTLSPAPRRRTSLISNTPMRSTMVLAITLGLAMLTPSMPAIASGMASIDQRAVVLASDPFDPLSGEIHASAQQVLLEGSRLVRDAGIGRARGTGAFGTQHDPAANDGAWIQVQQQNGRINADGNAARSRHDGTAMLVGADHQFEQGWRVGVFGGAGQTDFDVPDRQSSGDSRNRHAGIYAGNTWGAVALSMGYAHSWHRLDIGRRVASGGLSDAVASRYDAHSDQAFVDLGYRFGDERRELEPYLQYTLVEIDSDDFREQGGAAALQGRSDRSRTGLGGGGFRFAANLSGHGQEQTWLSVRGNVGYRRASGDRTRYVQASWDGHGWFDVGSPAITHEAVLAEIGVAARTSANSVLEAGVSRIQGDESSDTGFNARFSINF